MTRKEILSNEEYHLTLFQGEMYRLVSEHMDKSGLSVCEMADITDQTERVVKSILNGSCRLSISTMLDICLKLGYAPKFEFVKISEYDNQP